MTIKDDILTTKEKYSFTVYNNHYYGVDLASVSDMLFDTVSPAGASLRACSIKGLRPDMD